MRLDLYTMKSEEKVINKSKTLVKSTNFRFDDESNILTPSIVIEYFDGVFNCNYAFIESLGKRYYYITNIDIIDNNRMRLNLRVDVLETYWSQGLADTKQHIVRQENNYNMYLHDNTIITTGRFKTQTVISSPEVTFTTPTENVHSYVLNSV